MVDGSYVKYYDAMCKESPLLRDICVEFEEWRDKWSDWKT